MIPKTANVKFLRSNFHQKINETIFHPNAAHRKSYFDEVAKQNGEENYENINFIRDEWRISLPINNFDKLTRFNYAIVTVIDKAANNTTDYYCFVGDYDYITMTNVTVNFIPDVLTTWGVGNRITDNARYVNILRQHFSKQLFINNLDYLRRNDDTLAVQTLDYVHQDANFFSLDFVIFHCAADLGQEFGKVQAPEFKYSKGNVVNNMASPLNNYVVHYGDWQKFTELMSPYPWIMNQINNAIIIPQRLIDIDKDFGKVTGKSVDYKGILYQPHNGIKPKTIDLQGLGHNSTELGEIWGLTTLESLVLMREPYCGIHITNNGGSAIDLKPELLQPEEDGSYKKKIDIKAVTSYGYYNEMRCFPVGYNSNGENAVNHVYAGTFLENSISFNNFMSMPIAVDQRMLAIANQNANSRLAKAVSVGETAAKVAGDNGLGGGLLAKATGAVSKVAHSSIVNKISDTIGQFQLALQPDKKMLGQTISDMNTTNALGVANEFFGLVCKYERVNSTEINLAKQYHGQFGYKYGMRGTPSPLDTMSICNYLQIKGNWTIPDVPHDMMVYMSQLLESGVTFWHWKEGEPLEAQRQMVEDNKIIK